MPAAWEAETINFRVEHPRFLDSRGAHDRQLATKDLRAGSAVLVLEAGYNVDGTVAGQDGKPIAAADVAWWDSDSGAPVRVKTGADGRFRFDNRRPGLALITAEAPGLAMGVKQVQLGPPPPRPLPPAAAAPPDAPLPPGVVAAAPAAEAAELEQEPLLFASIEQFPVDAKQLARAGPCDPPLVVRLEPGRTIRGSVIDASGRPIAGARVTPEVRGRTGLVAWRGRDRRRWPVRVAERDARGGRPERRGSGEGPASPPLESQDPGRPDRREDAARAASAGQGRRRRDRPADRRFRIIEGIVWSHDFAPESDEIPPDWSRSGSRVIAGGSYEIRFPRPGKPGPLADHYYPLLAVRVEAEGYAPAVSWRYHKDVGEQTCDFALHKRPWIKGIVRAPDGSPAAGAEILVAVKGRPLPGIYNGRLVEGWRGEIVRTAPDGRYAFARPEAPRGLSCSQTRGWPSARPTSWPPGRM